MPVSKKHITIRIILAALLFIVIIACGCAFWLSSHYKSIVRNRLPGIVLEASDSIYHISFSDIDVSIFSRKITITNLKLWPDSGQVAARRARHRKTPPTLSTLSIDRLEAHGIVWADIPGKRSIDCRKVVIHKLKWLLSCTPHPTDSGFTHGKDKTPFIGRVTARTVEVTDGSDITYKYRGPHEQFSYELKGGSSTLNEWVYNDDEQKDTSLFLYAHNGSLRLDSFILVKSNGRYTVKKPLLDFSTTQNSVTLKNVKITQLTNHDPATTKTKEIYNLSFPKIEMNGFNWNKLIYNGRLLANEINAPDPVIELKYFDQNADNTTSKIGSYPQQLLLQVRISTNIKSVKITNGIYKYTEVTTKGKAALIEFTNITGTFSNLTNIPAVISENKNCSINLKGKYMNKNDVAADFRLSLADKSGHFSVDGYIKDLDGKDVEPQASAFTFVEVTHFHLDKMDMHIEGDETYSQGDFTVLYDGLKISLLKFDTKDRETKHGPFAFLGSTLLLYPQNPMPGKDVRKVSTSFARDTTKGFVSALWTNIYRAAKKTAVREQGIIILTDGKETAKGEHPKKGLLKRLFGKKK